MGKFLAALALIAGVVIGFATPANAGGCTGPLCGRIYLQSGSHASILIVNNWPHDASYTTKKRLDPGHKSTEFFNDTDGFYLPSGCKAHDRSWGTFGAGWHQINNAMNMSLWVYDASKYDGWTC